MVTEDLTKRIVSITELRRNFGGITANLSRIDALILTRGGEPFAILKAAPEERRKVIRGAAGRWRGTTLDKDSLWQRILRRKSRREPVSL